MGSDWKCWDVSAWQILDHEFRSCDHRQCQSTVEQEGAYSWRNPPHLHDGPSCLDKVFPQTSWVVRLYKTAEINCKDDCLPHVGFASYPRLPRNNAWVWQASPTRLAGMPRGSFRLLLKATLRASGYSQVLRWILGVWQTQDHRQSIACTYQTSASTLSWTISGSGVAEDGLGDKDWLTWMLSSKEEVVSGLLILCVAD